MAKKSAEEGVLVAAAKTIGKAAGTVAALTGMESAPKTTARVRTRPAGMLPKKNNAHLPRKLKKAQRKAQAAS